MYLFFGHYGTSVEPTEEFFGRIQTLGDYVGLALSSLY